MKPQSPQQRARAKKRAAGLIPYEAWVHQSNYQQLVSIVKRLQISRHTDDMAIPGYFTLTPDQRKFERLLSAYPTIYRFWDFTKRECDIERLTSSIGALSSGDQILAAFFLAVWIGDDQPAFGIVAAARTLDPEHRNVIAIWLADPYYP